MVEFLHSADAKGAFSALAYKKFKHVPLFLEWAPLAVFKSSATKEPKRNKDEVVEDVLAASVEGDVTGAVEGLGTLENRNTIFVKNLNFSTTEETLATIFGKVEKLILQSFVFYYIKAVMTLIKYYSCADRWIA